MYQDLRVQDIIVPMKEYFLKKMWEKNVYQSGMIQYASIYSSILLKDWFYMSILWEGIWYIFIRTEKENK